MKKKQSTKVVCERDILRYIVYPVIAFIIIASLGVVFNFFNSRVHDKEIVSLHKDMNKLETVQFGHPTRERREK
jgi:hypothetical protein